MSENDLDEIAQGAQLVAEVHAIERRAKLEKRHEVSQVSQELTVANERIRELEGRLGRSASKVSRLEGTIRTLVDKVEVRTILDAARKTAPTDRACKNCKHLSIDGTRAICDAGQDRNLGWARVVAWSTPPSKCAQNGGFWPLVNDSHQE